MEDDKKNRDRFDPSKNLNRQYFQISLYVIGTVIVIYILIHMLDKAGPVLGTLGQAVAWIAAVLKPLLFGFVIAYLLYPLVGFFEKQIDRLKERVLKKINRKGKGQKSSRGAAVLVTWILIVLFLFLILSLIISTVTHELQVVNPENLGQAIDNISDTINGFYTTLTRKLEKLSFSSEKLNELLRTAGEEIGVFVQGIGTGFVGLLSDIPSMLTELLFSVIFAIYFMTDGEGLRKYWGRVARAFVNKKVLHAGGVFIRDADKVFSGYIRGQLIDAVFMAVAVAVSLSLVGVRYSVIIGLLTGIGNLIPYVGPFVAYISTILVSLLDGDMKRLIIAVVILFILQTVDGNIVNPRLLSSAVDVHPMLVIAALIVGGAFGGLLGMLLAVPCGALIKVYFEKVVDATIKKQETREKSRKT